MVDKYESIRPFNKREAIVVRREVFADESFKKALDYLQMGITLEELKEESKTYESHYDFQVAVPRRLLEFISNKSTSHVSYHGIENVEKNVPYLYVANHRDIILDSGYLQLYFFNYLWPTSKIAIGDNLIQTPLLKNIARLNKMFLVKRGGTLRERLLNSKLLSEYIHYSLVEEKESIWIAQKNGRTKNGIDKTQQGLIKMLTYFDEEGKDVVQLLKEMRIVPLTISYEYEPCDQLKARELALSENEKYVKKQGEDFNSICTGLFGYKGEVSIVIGKPLEKELDEIPSDWKKNDKILKVCELIDAQIHQNYKLYATNYIAYDILEKSDEFSDRYSQAEKDNFVQYLQEKSVIEDVPQEKMFDYLLHIYANPVKTKFGKILINHEENDW